MSAQMKERGSEQAPQEAGGYTYLTTEQLAERIHYDARTIRIRLKDTVLHEGTHYVRPFGGRKLLFIWETIERDMLGPVAWQTKQEFEQRRRAEDASTQAQEHGGQAKQAERTELVAANPIGPMEPDRKRWTDEELGLLCKTLGEPEAIETLAEKLGRTPRSLRERYARMAREGLGSARPNGRGPLRPWTDEELVWMQEHYAESTAEQLRARFPHRRLLAVRCRASEMGLTLKRADARRLATQRAAEGSLGPHAGAPDPGPETTAPLIDPLHNYSQALSGLDKWTLAELRLLQQLCASGVSDQEIRERLEKSRKELRNAKFYLGISPQKPRRWSAAQEQRLTRSFHVGGIEQCLADTRDIRSPEEVRRRLVCLGLVPGRQVVWRPWEKRYLLQAIALHYPIDEVAYSLAISRDLAVARARSLGCAEQDIEASLLRGGAA